MKLEFEIKNKTMEMKNTNIPIDDIIICNFSFLTKEWKNKEKYIILWNEKNKTKIVSLGKRKNIEYTIPKFFSESHSFSIQIYVNDNIKTQKFDIKPISSDPSKKETINVCNKKKKLENPNIYDIKNILNEILTKLDSKISSVDYDDGYLKCYIGSKLVYSKPIFDEVLKDVEEIVIDLNKDISGNYNDLKNIPTEFNPSKHTHQTADIIDYEGSINIDLDLLLDALGDEISKE